MYRCISHMFGYCYSKPQSDIREIEVIHLDYKGKSYIQKTPLEVCVNNYRTCSQYRTHSQQYPVQAVVSPAA